MAAALHEIPELKARWLDALHSAGNATEKGICLVSGRQGGIALTHPSIKGVPGAQSSGAALVSFNAPAFCSYGHEQGENAPVSEYAAFAYTTALNTLLASRDHCRILGDTAVVCWAEKASPSYSSLGMMAMFGIPENHGLTEDDLSKALDNLAKGQPCSWMGEDLQPGQHFYVLGLSPNAARISVRFFYRDTMGKFAAHLQQHAKALEIDRPPYDQEPLISISKIVRETLNFKERNPKPSPQLSGALLRAALTGAPYPSTLLHSIASRIHADQKVTPNRAAILKAYYLRNASTLSNHKEILDMKLNDDSNYCPYVLGRLFATLEHIQSDANSEINTTIRDRYFNAACETPEVVFPTLINLAQKHLKKLTPAQQINYNKLLTHLFSKIDETLPAHTTLPEQGAFQIGYYHQMRKFYTKKDKED